jgi:predicted metalloendopeptidase
MSKTKKNRNKNTNKRSKHNKTRKNSKCPIGLKPFEEKFSLTLPKGHLKVSSNKKNKIFVKQLLSKFAPNSIKPENNFYDYINYQWLKNVSLEEQQKYIVQVDDFRLTQDKVYTQLNDIILEYIKTHNDKLSQNLKNYHKSVIDMNPKPYSRRLAFEVVKTIEHFIAEKNPWKLLAFFNKDEMLCNSAPFVWSLNPDDKNTKLYRCYVSPHQFELIDLNVYYDDGTEVSYKKRYREEYTKNVKDIFNILLGKHISLLLYFINLRCI